MKYRRLGRDGPLVSAIGMGRGARPLGLEADPMEAEFRAAIRRAVEIGINFFDTSDAYWGGRHEVLLGRALRGLRGQVLVATKFGNLDTPEGGKAANGRPAYVFAACEASLKRLGREPIDLYYLHRVDPEVPIEETVGAMARLVEQGKVRYLGLCEASPETLRRAWRTHPIAALQTEYSLWYREVEREVLPACRELGIGYVAYAPLGRGLLTGRIRTMEDLPREDRRRRHPRFHPENLARNVQLVAALEAAAREKGVAPAELALAWLLAQGEDIVPIPGTNQARYVEQNAAAAEIALSEQEIARLSEIFAIGAGAGARYPDTVLAGVGI